MYSPRILIVTPGLGTGGAQNVFKYQVKYFSKTFNATGCIFNWDGALTEEKSLDMLSLEIPAGKFWITKFYYFLLRIVKLRQIKRKFKIDISISHLEGADYVNILSALDDKVVCYIHGSKFHDQEIKGVLGFIRRKILIPILYRHADLIITVSSGIRDEFTKSLKISTDRVRVITNGLDLSRIEEMAKVPIPKEWQALFKNNVTICMCGRLAPPKNHLAFLSVFAKLLARLQCKLVIIGDGSLRNILHLECTILGLRVYSTWDNLKVSDQFDVYFTGNQLNPFSYMKNASVFAFPSAWEGFPLALCEAMACGIAVVASDCPTGPREILIDSEGKEDFGTLLPIPMKNDWTTQKVWTQALEQLLTDKKLAEDYAAKGRFRVQDFSVEKMQDSWNEVITDLTGE